MTTINRPESDREPRVFREGDQQPDLKEVVTPDGRIVDLADDGLWQWIDGATWSWDELLRHCHHVTEIIYGDPPPIPLHDRTEAAAPHPRPAASGAQHG